MDTIYNKTRWQGIPTNTKIQAGMDTPPTATWLANSCPQNRASDWRKNTGRKIEIKQNRNNKGEKPEEPVNSGEGEEKTGNFRQQGKKT